MALEFSNAPAAAPAVAAPVTPAAAPAAAAPAAAAASPSAAVAAPAAGAAPAAAVSSAATAPVAPAATGFLDGPVEEAPVLGADGKPVAPAVDDKAKAEADALAATEKEKADGVKAIETALGKMTAEEKAAYDALSADDRAAADAKIVEAAAKAATLPVYTDFTLPKDTAVDGPLMEKAKTVFAEKGLSQDQAQAVIDLYSGDVLKAVTEAAAKPYDLWRDTQAKWQEDIKADAEIGGAKMQAAMANGAKAIDMFSTTKEEAKALREALAFTGATNNPAIARFFARVGAKISEGKFVPGNPPAPAPKTAAEVLFPNHVKAAT